MYSFAIACYAFVVRLISPFHKKARLMIKGQKQTFDILRKNINPDSTYIWFHAASLGEFEQGRPMIEKIKDKHPEVKILLTFFSPSGYEVRKNYEGADIICYLPFDIKKNVRKFLQLARPTVAIFIKYEFWMNYLGQLNKQNIPTYIISAIFRPDQIFFKPYAKVYRSILKYYTWFFVQDESSKKILEEHDVLNVTVSGDTRFDRVYEIYKQCKQLPLIEQFAKAKDEAKKFILVAGSSWDKDEELLIPYFNNNPEVRLIIAPHEIHKERLQSIISGLQRPYVLYSEASEEDIQQKDCIIIDCFGLLSSVYRYGDIAYVGGGFGVGIHNILEAATYGIPVVFGPNYNKFREAHELIKEGGGFSISDKASFNSKMNELTTYNEVLQASGQRAGKYIQENIGSTDIILQKISSQINNN